MNSANNVRGTFIIRISDHWGHFLVSGLSFVVYFRASGCRATHVFPGEDCNETAPRGTCGNHIYLWRGGGLLGAVKAKGSALGQAAVAEPGLDPRHRAVGRRALPTVGQVGILGQLLQLPAQVGRLIHALFLCDLQDHVLLQQLLDPFLVCVPILGQKEGRRGDGSDWPPARQPHRNTPLGTPLRQGLLLDSPVRLLLRSRRMS